jgi:hypothetical protein
MHKTQTEFCLRYSVLISSISELLFNFLLLLIQYSRSMDCVLYIVIAFSSQVVTSRLIYWEFQFALIVL